MPITQTRMILLINAARDYQRAFAEAQTEIEQQFKLDPQNESLRHLRTFISESVRLQHPVDSRLTIEREFSHFRHRAKYNDRQRTLRQINHPLKPKPLDLRHGEYFLRSTTAPLQSPTASIDKHQLPIPTTIPTTIPQQPLKIDPTRDEPTDAFSEADLSTADPDFTDLNPIADDHSLDAEVQRALDHLDRIATSKNGGPK